MFYLSEAEVVGHVMFMQFVILADIKNYYIIHIESVGNVPKKVLVEHIRIKSVATPHILIVQYVQELEKLPVLTALEQEK